MPGPKATVRKRRDPAPNSPNKKTAKRLAARQAGYVERNTQNQQVMHKPGSQNRKK